MAEDRIDSLVDRVAVQKELSETSAEVRQLIDLIKSVKNTGIQITGAKSVSEFNAINKQLQDQIKLTNTATTSVKAYTAAIKTEGNNLKQNIELRKRLQNTSDSYKTSQKEDLALLKAGTINRAEYNKRIVESQAKIETYKVRVTELNRVIKEDIALEGRAGDAYKQLSAEYNRAALAAKNYQITLGANNPITIAAVKNAKDLSNQLKSVDDAVGQNTRNVGNYSSAFEKGFSKIWTGLRTAANIIPGLGIGGLIGGIVGSIASLASSVASAQKPFKELKEANDALNESMSQTKYKEAVADVKTLKTEIQLAKQGFIDKDEVVKKYNETIGKTTGQVTNLNEAEQALNKNAEAYIRFTLLKAAANEVQQQAAKELVDAEIQNQKDLVRIAKIGARDRPGDKDGISEFIKSGEENLRKAEQDAAAKRVKGLENIADKFLKEAAQISKDFNFNFFEEPPSKEKKGKADDKQKQEEARLKALFEIQKTELETQAFFAEQIVKDENRTYSDRLRSLNDYYIAKQKIIDLTADFELMASKNSAEEIKLIETKRRDESIRLAYEVSNVIKRTTIDLNGNNKELQTGIEGMTKSISKALDEIKKKNDEARDGLLANMKAIKDAVKQLASELRGLLFDVFTADIDRQKNAVQDQIDLLEKQKQKDIETANQSIANAQERAAAIAVIEARAAAQKEQLERRQRQLSQQKARFDRAEQVANIIGNTARGITAALASVPPNPVLAAIVGAIGAAQLARVLVTPIPKYKHGGVHKGGLMEVGDGGRHEGIELPDGTILKSPARSTLMEAPAGTVIHPDYNKMMLNATITKVPEFKVKTTSNDDTLKRVGKDIVRAIRSQPQPIIKTESGYKKIMRKGNTFTEYLNNNL